MFASILTKPNIKSVVRALLFELIRNSIGTQEGLSSFPSESEWYELYDMVVKQSLVGVCFIGLHRLGADSNYGFTKIGMNEDLYFTWMGMAAQIKMKNEVVYQQCVELQKRLSAVGFHSCMLKGVGVAALYGEELDGFRQSGDIDVWVQNKSIENLVEYVMSVGVKYKATAAHVECSIFEDTEVELHSDPAFMRNLRKDRKLKEWFRNYDVSCFERVNGMVIPPMGFNLVYMMVHMYHHVLFEGLGLRQVMDYYFVLLAAAASGERFDVRDMFREFGILKFASGIMWVVSHVFANDFDLLDIEPNEKVGRLLLDEILRGGNFGHHEEKNQNLHGGTAICRLLNEVKRNMRFIALGPWEVLCSPFWSMWHYFWRKRHGFL